MTNYDIYQFDHFCNIRDKILNEISKIYVNRAISELSIIMRHENDRFCIIAKDLVQINENIIPNNIIGIMFCREVVNNNTIIINLLKTNEKRPKMIARNMIDELVVRCKDNMIKYIYMETKYNPNLFYSDQDDDTYVLTGFMLDSMSMKSKDPDSDLLDNNIVFYLFKKNFFEYILTLRKKGKLIGKISLFLNKTTNGYMEIEINSIDSNDINDVVITTLDNIASNNYISRIYIKTTDDDEIFTANHYTKCKLSGYEKKTNTIKYIDRTVLSYYYT
jgi:hypothetical protein